MPPVRVGNGPLMSGEAGAESPHDAFYYYAGAALRGVRSGQWKLMFPQRYRYPRPAGKDGNPGVFQTAEIGLSLFDLENDISEEHNVAGQHPAIVKRLQALAERAREDLGDSDTNRKSKNLRPLGRVNK